MVNNLEFNIFIDLQCLGPCNPELFSGDISTLLIDENGIDSIDEFTDSLVDKLEQQGFEVNSWDREIDNYDPTFCNHITMYQPLNQLECVFNIQFSDNVVLKLASKTNESYLSDLNNYADDYFQDKVGWWVPDTFKVNEVVFPNLFQSIDFIKSMIVGNKKVKDFSSLLSTTIEDIHSWTERS